MRDINGCALCDIPYCNKADLCQGVIPISPERNPMTTPMTTPQKIDRLLSLLVYTVASSPQNSKHKGNAKAQAHAAIADIITKAEAAAELRGRIAEVNYLMRLRTELGNHKLETTVLSNRLATLSQPQPEVQS